MYTNEVGLRYFLWTTLYFYR